jgi:L-ascorbate metabolism protein UlaG (beta-lactamase superfamily)
MTRLTAGLAIAALLAGCAGMEERAVGPGTVKITALGTHDGELCPIDRAMVFEDPDGTRILYDAGRTVRGPDDPRLGKIDAVLLSHVHADHLGDAHQPSANAGLCGKPDVSVRVTPNSNTVNIVAGKKARLLVGSDMAAFFAIKVQAAGGDPKQVQLLRFGATTKVGGVTVATVPATHTNAVPPEFLDKALGEALRANGLSADVGPPTGYVLQFSNGLVAYLSGDTGITAEQDVTVRRYFKANLAVMNIGGFPFTTGPAESAFVIAELVKPNSVIATHVNEVATKGGKLVPGTKTEQFMKRVGIPTYIPLSGRTMSFDGNGLCTSGC